MSQPRKADLRRYYLPTARGGPTSLENLALSCYAWQLQKLAFQTGQDPTTHGEVILFNPRRQRWSCHFRWSADGLHLEGLTRVGRATIERLALNHWRQVQARVRWIAHPDLFP
jgi:hypothetical protein